MNRILVVDDDKNIRASIMRILADEGYQIELCQNGQEALEKVHGFKPDIILLDVNMPGMDGFEVCRLIKSNETLKDIMILFQTARDIHEDRMRGYALQADDYIVKPYENDELRARIRVLLRLRNAIADLRVANTDLETRVQARTRELSTANEQLKKEIFEREILQQELQTSHDNLVQAYNTTIEGWSRALDYRDKETEGHSQRVTDLTLKIASFMGMGDDELIHVRRGALLHDIGKLGVPDRILLKPGPLTDEEWQIMRSHTDIAFKLLSPVPYLRQSLDIPYCHHEKWDGSGYPQGLKGQQIPLGARIFAIIDVWDALTSDRPYRPAWSREKTLAHIRAQSGTHFDPKVVAAFLEVFS
ncbi:MAG: HD domain-containing phosphohydrolase [Pseudomonadota bacterium]